MKHPAPACKARPGGWGGALVLASWRTCACVCVCVCVCVCATVFTRLKCTHPK